MVNIAYLTQTRSDKNLGKSLNDVISCLPDDYWICSRDVDTLVMDTSMFTKQCEEIADKNEFSLVSCMTNRLSIPHQLINGKSQPEHCVDLNEEINRCRSLARQYGSHVNETDREVAGVMMLFPKRVWKEVGGFREGGILFGSQLVDNVFYMAIRRKGFRIGIAPGIYLLHLYRWGKDKRDQKHLIL